MRVEKSPVVWMDAASECPHCYVEPGEVHADDCPIKADQGTVLRWEQEEDWS